MLHALEILTVAVVAFPATVYIKDWHGKTPLGAWLHSWHRQAGWRENNATRLARLRRRGQREERARARMMRLRRSTFPYPLAASTTRSISRRADR
jgi:hypothetical protein